MLRRQCEVSKCFGWYLTRLPNFPFSQQNAFRYTTKSKRTISTNLLLSYLQQGAAQYSGARRVAVEGTPPPPTLEISRDTQCKTSSSRFQKKTWHIESGCDQTTWPRQQKMRVTTKRIRKKERNQHPEPLEENEGDEVSLIHQIPTIATNLPSSWRLSCHSYKKNPPKNNPIQLFFLP